MNAALFFENPDPKSYVSLVPTSAHSGDGMGNLIALLIEYSQTRLAKRLAFSDKLQCTTLEVSETALSDVGPGLSSLRGQGQFCKGPSIGKNLKPLDTFGTEKIYKSSQIYK